MNRRLGMRLAGDLLFQFVTCGQIVQEVVQGLREVPASDSFRDSLLAIPRLSDPLPCSLFLQAADIYRRGRQKGYTIRSSADCLIAAIAIENKVPVWHQDRDFDIIARYTGLHASQHLERLTVG